MEKPQSMLNASVKPSMISTGTQSDEILLVLDVNCFLIVKWVSVLEVVAHAAILRLGRLVHR